MSCMCGNFPKRHYSLKQTDGFSGLAVIFAFGEFNSKDSNLNPRSGVENEVSHLKYFFQLLNLRVHVLRDLYCNDLSHALSVISNPEKHQETRVTKEIWNARILPHDSVCCIAITSHGCGPQIVCSDGILIHELFIESLFNEDNCSILRGKPKIFIYNKCRSFSGVKYETVYPNPCAGVEPNNSSTDIQTSNKDEIQKPHFTSTNQHMISFYTCASGTQSYSLKSGSIVLSKLPGMYETWRNDVPQGHFLDFLTDFMSGIVPVVREALNKGDVTQFPSIERLRLPNYLYFFFSTDAVDCPISDTTPLNPIADTPSKQIPNKIASSRRLSTEEREMQENKSKSPRKSCD